MNKERFFRQRVWFSALMALAVGFLFICTACSKEPLPVELDKKGSQKNGTHPVRHVTPLRIGMGAMITPHEGYVYYQHLRDYIEKKLGQPVLMVDRGSYSEMNNLLETGGVDIAFVCAGPYVEGKKKFGMELLAMPLVKGRSSYQAYIIVPRDSPARSLQDLRGKVFAFADPKSNSGKVVPTYMLSKLNETPDSFFSSYKYTYGHDVSIRAVAEKLVDGAAVDSLIWEYIARKTPAVTERTRIVAKSDFYGIPPVVVRPGLDPKLKRKIRDILVSASSDGAGKEILRGMMIDGFVPGNDANYDSIRSINAWLAGKRKRNQ